MPRFARQIISMLPACCAVLLGGCSGSTSQPQQESVSLPHGPFEIVARGRRISAGGFPNNSGNPFATMEVTGFTVNRQGKAVSIRHGDTTLTHFWRVMRVAGAPQPALLASTTDFHLITEVDGQLVVQSFGEPSTDLAELQWLDENDGQPGPSRNYGIQKVDTTSGLDLAGGRWLRLSHHTVLDVQTLKAYPIQAWIEEGRPFAGYNGGGQRALAFSPGRTQYVTVGSGTDRSRGDRHDEALLVVDIPTGEVYGLPLGRKLNHYISMDDVTPSWVAHYFEWTRNDRGQERLVPRRQARPLPWLGQWLEFSGDTLEYRLRAARPEMKGALSTFIQERLQGKVMPDWMEPGKRSGDTLSVPGCDGVIALSSTETHVGVFSPSGTGGKACRGAVQAIGKAFDRELAAGRFQDLFVDE